MRNIRRSLHGLICVLILVPTLLGANGTASGKAPQPSASILSGWEQNGVALNGPDKMEWGDAPSIPFGHGNLYLLNDFNYLYVLIDETGATTHDDPNPNSHTHWFSLSFDVSGDGLLTPDADAWFHWDGSGSRAGLKKNIYLASGWSNPLRTASQVATGFSPSPASTIPHRWWEAAINLREISAFAGKTIGMGMEAVSLHPAFQDDLPANFLTNFTSLLTIHLAVPASSDCQPLDVPQYYQGYDATPLKVLAANKQPDWASQAYGNHPNGDPKNTIGHWGSMTTAVAMVLGYYAELYQTPYLPDPGNLNAWLRAHLGYTRNDNLKLSAIVDYAWENLGIQLTRQVVSAEHGYNPYLDAALCAGNPAVLQVETAQGLTYVTAIGKTTVGINTTYIINDPIWGRTTLLDHYQNVYFASYYFQAKSTDAAMIQVVADSPVHLILTDPLGRKTGNDPRIGNDWDDLPGGEYGLEYITAPDGTSTSLDNFLYLALPVDGIYCLEAVGVTSGPYSLILTQTDAMGHLSQTILSGTAQPGSDQTYTITVGPVNQLFLPEIMGGQ